VTTRRIPGAPAILRRLAGEIGTDHRLALRQIGKRSRALNRAAIRTARSLRNQANATARWIGADARRELSGPAVQQRLGE